MIFKICLVCLLAIPLNGFSSEKDLGYLRKEDQKYFKNDSFEGQGKSERIDMNVKEINKIYGELEQLRAEVAKLKQEVEGLKAKK